jgi:hypothetical protein
MCERHSRRAILRSDKKQKMNFVSKKKRYRSSSRFIRKRSEGNKRLLGWRCTKEVTLSATCRVKTTLYAQDW